MACHYKAKMEFDLHYLNLSYSHIVNILLVLNSETTLRSNIPGKLTHYVADASQLDIKASTYQEEDVLAREQSPWIIQAEQLLP